MSYVYMLYRHSDNRHFYVGETNRPVERLNEHCTDYMCSAAKTCIIMDEASKDGGFTLQLLFDTPKKTSGRAVEALISYFLHITIINHNVKYISNLIDHVTYESLRDIKVSPHGLSIIQQIQERTANPVEDAILEILLKMCKGTCPDESYSKLIDTRYFNMGHKFIRQWQESLK